MTPKIAFIGAGNMGSALLHSFLSSQEMEPEHLRVCDRNLGKLQGFQKLGAFITQNPQEAIEGANFVFLAIKPQDIPEMLSMLEGYFERGTVLVSIAAGLTVQFLQEKTDLSKIIRVMPNTPVMVHEGVSGMYATASVSEEEREYIKDLLQHSGIVIDCEEEDQITAVTALSGSGPGYIFRILEIFAAKAEEFGFSKSDAKRLALHTFVGSGKLALESEEDFELLRKMVTSKGGTTEAALKKFDELGLEKVLSEGIDACARRANELGK